MQIGGEELPMHDQRLDHSLFLMYYAEPTPGRHTQGAISYTPPETPLPEERGLAHKIGEDWQHVIDACGFCLFINTFVLPFDSTREFLNAACDREFTNDELQAIGARISLLRHAFNHREGIKFTDRKVPKRLLEAPEADGPIKGSVIDKDTLVKEYIAAAQYDPTTLYPKKEVLQKYGLDFVIPDLYPNG